MMARLAVVAVLVVVVAACGGGAGAAGASVRITRTPGLFILPPVGRTVTDVAVVTRLASDIEKLPLFPSRSVACPADTGTSYTLAFAIPGKSPWTAVVSVSGCRGVTLSDGPTRSAASSPSLFTDLGSALGLALDELIPGACPAPTGGRCYAQPTR